MKKLTVKKGSECMACLQCVQACSEAFYKVNDVTKCRFSLPRPHTPRLSGSITWQQ